MRLRRVVPVLALLAAALAATPASAQVTLVSSAARTASGTQAVTITAPDLYDSAVFLLSVSAAATEVGDTLDVYVQSSPDGGTTWDDFIHFTQVLGNGGAKKHLASWAQWITAESEMKAPADAALAAGVLQGPVSGTWRVKWVVVDAGTANASFTFSVTMSGRRGVVGR
jgi:hypothetical protein